MATLSISDIQRLISNSGETCVSFYFPTHSHGIEVINHKDQLVFKNLIKEADVHLQKLGWEEDQSRRHLTPALELLKDPDIWRFRTNGMAVFLDENGLKYFDLPFSPQPEFQVSAYFYVIPILPMLTGDGNYYLLTLDMHNILLYKGHREGMEEIEVEDEIPQRMEEVVGTDYEQSSLQFRSQQDGFGGGTFHGKGDWKGEVRKEETYQFFKEVNRKLKPFLADNLPLMLAGQEFLTSIYRKANNYPFLYEKHVTVNPKDLDLKGLHQASWKKIYPLFDKERSEKEDEIRQFRDTKKTSIDMEDVYVNALGGRVEALFLEKEYDVWGVYDPARARFRIDDEQKISNVSLVNMLALEVISKGGKIYIQPRETLPLPYAPINALYRY